MKGLFLLCALLMCARAPAQEILQVITSNTVVFSAQMYYSMCVRTDGQEPRKCYVRKLSASDKRWLMPHVTEDYGIAFNEGPRTIVVSDTARIYLFTYMHASLGKEHQFSGMAYWRDGEELRACTWKQETPGYAAAKGYPVVKLSRGAQEDLDFLLERYKPVPIDMVLDKEGAK